MAKRRSVPNAKRDARLRPVPMVDVLSSRLQAARGLWNEGRQADALCLFAEAIRQEPNNVRAYVLTARAYAEKFSFDKMGETHDQLVRRAPRHPGIHHYIGETFGLLKLPERAIASYEQAAGLPGAGGPTWMELAALYERSHRLEEAEQLIERTVRAGFDLPTAALVRGRIQRRQKRVDQAEATFRDLLARVPENSEWACQAWGEIALIRDQAEDYPAAAHAIAQCKRVQQQHEARFWAAAEKLHTQMRELIATISRDDFCSWHAASDSMSPQRTALLTGFPRSGTTLLEQVLDAHPDLVSSEERDFIGRELLHAVVTARGKVPLLDVLRDQRPEELERERIRYFRAMEYFLHEPIGGRMHLDKNPAYNLTIPLVLRVFPSTRLIVALRDPRDVIVSCYLRYLPLNAVSVCFLDIARAAERYALDMSAWLKYRDLVAVPWCEVRYEDTVANLEAQARRALGTLGLPWDDTVLQYRERLTGSKQVTSPTYDAVVQPIYTRAIGRWQHYAQLVEPALKTLEPFIREFGYSL